MDSSKIESEKTTVIYIVPHLLNLIKFLNKILFKLQCFLVDRYMQNSPPDNSVPGKYRTLRVDAMPIVEQRQLYDYRHLLNEYLEKHVKPLEPVNRRSKFAGLSKSSNASTVLSKVFTKVKTALIRESFL